MTSAAARAPGPRGGEVLGTLLRRARDPFRTMVELARRYGPVVEIRVGGTSHFLVSGAAEARHVLVDNQSNYVKGPGYALWGRILGRGLVTSDGEHWRSHRRLVQPSLHRDRMDEFAAVMSDVALAEAHRLTSRAGAVVDVYDRMTRIALRIAARAFLGTDLRAAEDELCDALTEVFAHVQRLSASPLRAVGMIPGLRVLDPAMAGIRGLLSPGERRFEDALETLDRVIGEVISRRRAAMQEPERHDDLVSRLLRAASEHPGTTLTDRDIRDEVVTMFVAGHETTAAGLTWCLHLLAEHPDHQDRVAAEALVLPPDAGFRVQDLDGLGHARRVFQESLRLFPPVWRLSRHSLREDRLGGHPVPPGSVIIVSPFLIHRDPDLWDRADEFDPSRFDGPDGEARPRDAYLPFGGGRRGCPGGGFATVEAQVVLSALCRRLVFTPGYATRPDFEPRLTLQPRGGMPLRITLREPAPRP
ncbi:MAG TPA: cytochrome P450 [Longimicrobiales bacterium]|nr:cytochrome P450 [Longimicrobiales bacterium]